jgi:ABC-type Zn2+ transport system substrate-binding protein/surface adhesin
MELQQKNAKKKQQQQQQHRQHHEESNTKALQKEHTHAHTQRESQMWERGREEWPRRLASAAISARIGTAAVR